MEILKRERERERERERDKQQFTENVKQADTTGVVVG
jgi:hypothetical protein